MTNSYTPDMNAGESISDRIIADRVEFAERTIFQLLTTLSDFDALTRDPFAQETIRFQRTTLQLAAERFSRLAAGIRAPVIQGAFREVRQDERPKVPA